VNYMLFLMPRLRGSCLNNVVCANHAYKPRVWDEAGTELTPNSYFSTAGNFVYSDWRSQNENCLDRWSTDNMGIFLQTDSDFFKTNAAAERNEIQSWFILKLPKKDKYIMKARTWSFYFHENDPQDMADVIVKKWTGGGEPPLFTTAVAKDEQCYFGGALNAMKETKKLKDAGAFDNGWSQSGTLDMSEAGNQAKVSFVQSNISLAISHEEGLGWYANKGVPKVDAILDASMTGAAPCTCQGVTDPVDNCQKMNDDKATCETSYSSQIPGCSKCGWFAGQCLTTGPIC